MIKISSIHFLEFKIGGFFSSNYSITIVGDSITFFSDPYRFDEGERHTKTASVAALKLFISELNKLKVQQWKRRYENYDALDGEQWSLEIQYNNLKRKKRIYGSNEYPGSITNSVERTTEFCGFLNTLKTLIDEPDFFSESYFNI
ncbi:MAG TPA: hypothetical protein VMV56_05800 [Williamwhitmania sp.]|nr:hypothetical protein [Williamwhitmania sp.]